MESDITIIRILSRFKMEFWSFGIIDQIWIKNVEFIALDNFGWWVILVIMSLVVFIPFIANFNSVEILRFSWYIFAFPIIMLFES